MLIWRAVNLFEQCALSLTLYMNHDDRGVMKASNKNRLTLSKTPIYG